MIASLISWINGPALTTWGTRGFDHERDLFHERLSFDQTPLAVPYRAMVQARQIYVFSHAALLELSADAADKADRAMRQLVRLFSTSDAGETSFAFSVDPASGVLISGARDSYTHAFVLLATASLFRVTHDRALVALAEATTRFVERRMTDATHGGVVDMLPSAAGQGKRQNPQMHLLEAYLALAEAIPGQGYLERALELVSLFRDRMFDPNAGVLPEYFADDWTRHPDPARAAIFEPGHHYEWVWLLNRVEQLSGEKLGVERGHLWTAARSDGHAANGLIVDEVDAGRNIVSPSHRLWPHTEAIKAATAMVGVDRADARRFADAMAKALLETFLRGPFDGGWIDHVTPDLAPRVTYVPASSLYHLFLAGAEAAAALGDPAFPPTGQAAG